MEIFLPIAGVEANFLALITIGFASGIIAGMFGIGGGVLATPLLFLYGIPPIYAVSSSINQALASSFSGLMSFRKHRLVDFKLGGLLVLGAVFGVAIGTNIFIELKTIDGSDRIIRTIFVVILYFVAFITALESYNKFKNKLPHVKKHVVYLPFPTYFKIADIHASYITVILIGFLISSFMSVIGLGGGILMIPALINILGLRTIVAFGTSFLYVIFMTMTLTFLHASQAHTVDFVLSFYMVIGSVIGAFIGSRISLGLPSHALRVIFALLVLSVALRLSYDLYTHKTYSLDVIQEQAVANLSFLSDLMNNHSYYYALLCITYAAVMGVVSSIYLARKVKISE